MNNPIFKTLRRICQFVYLFRCSYCGHEVTTQIMLPADKRVCPLCSRRLCYFGTKR